ncbi:MAG TPA: Rrf2 family transcriptional regulator [Ruminococcaceae bacterium]|nr:Rrf2 family transcriptional regulator [Oscillospiraceae bacterium]
MISTKGRYALRVMIDIGRHQSAAPVSVKDISSRQDISVKYLEQVVSILSKAGLIRSFRGNAGGYKLNVDPEKCTAGDILRVCEGSLSPVACLQDEKNYCERSSYCETLDFWRGFYDVINKYADSVTIQDLIDKADSTNGSYCI